MKTQTPLDGLAFRVGAIRTAPDRLPLSPAWEARARDLWREWTRVAVQVDALARSLQTGITGGPGSVLEGRPAVTDGRPARHVDV